MIGFYFESKALEFFSFERSHFYILLYSPYIITVRSGIALELLTNIVPMIFQIRTVNFLRGCCFNKNQLDTNVHTTCCL